MSVVRPWGLQIYRNHLSALRKVRGQLAGKSGKLHAMPFPPPRVESISKPNSFVSSILFASHLLSKQSSELLPTDSAQDPHIWVAELTNQIA
jgi:hypothetical protein